MKTLTKVLTAVVLIGGLMVSSLNFAVQAEKKPALPAYDFKGLMQKILEAWGTLDPAKAAPFYAQEPTRVFYDLAPMKYTGWKAYAEGVPKELADYTSIAFTLGKDAVAHPRGNFAWGTTTWHAEMVKKDGSKEALDGRWTVLWEKHGEDWLVVHEHLSVPIGPPPTKK
jgi:ketosteroid isomerase-like protein